MNAPKIESRLIKANRNIVITSSSDAIMKSIINKAFINRLEEHLSAFRSATEQVDDVTKHLESLGLIEDLNTKETRNYSGSSLCVISKVLSTKPLMPIIGKYLKSKSVPFTADDRHSPEIWVSYSSDEIKKAATALFTYGGKGSQLFAFARPGPMTFSNY